MLGAYKALDLGFGIVQAVIVGTVTAVGGGTIRDVLIGRIPTVLRSELYAIPALIGATCVGPPTRSATTARWPRCSARWSASRSA